MSGYGLDRNIDRDTHLTIIERAVRLPRRLDRDECRELLRVACLATLLPLEVVMAGLGSGLTTIVLLALTLVVCLVLRPSRPRGPVPASGAVTPTWLGTVRPVFPRPRTRRTGLTARIRIGP